MYYSMNCIASTFCNGVSIVFFSHQPGYLFLDYNMEEVDSDQQQVLDRFFVVLAPSLRLCVRCVHAVIAVCSLLFDYRSAFVCLMQG